MWKMRAKLLYHVEFFIRMLYDTFKNSDKKNKKKKSVHTEFLLSVIGNIECEIHYPWIFIIKEFNPGFCAYVKFKKRKEKVSKYLLFELFKIILENWLDSINYYIFNKHFYLYSLKLLLPLVRLIKYWLALFVSHQWLTHIRAYIY